MNTERLLYISEEINKYKDGKVSFTYSYLGEKQTKALEDGESFTLTIPSANIGQFKVENVQGDIAMVSMFKKDITGIYKTDDNIKVSRKYSARGRSDAEGNSFKQNDIIRVEISTTIGAKALSGGYEVTDFLPSGLKPIENPWNFGIQPGREDYYCRVDGQKVTFYVYNDDKHQTRSMGYYARVVSPGTYKADGTIIQGILSRESINVGKTDQLTIDR